MNSSTKPRILSIETLSCPQSGQNLFHHNLRGDWWLHLSHFKNGSSLNSSQRYLKFFLRLIMVDRSDDVEGHTRTRERMAHGNVYALVRRPDRVCVSLFRPYRD